VGSTILESHAAAKRDLLGLGDHGAGEQVGHETACMRDASAPPLSRKQFRNRLSDAIPKVIDILRGVDRLKF
jgi:hypothetical protein